MVATNNDAAGLEARSIVTTRVFDAPRALVFEAWTDPAHIGVWWGPDGFTTTTLEIDVRVGGAWRFIMHGPDGVDYPNNIVYTEITPPKRLAYTHGDDGDAPSFQTTVIFTEESGKTRLTMTAIFVSPAERDMVVAEYGAVEGARQTLGRLAEYLATV